MPSTLALALVPVVLASTSKEHTESFLGFGAPDYPAEAARAAGQDKHFAFEREVKKLEGPALRSVVSVVSKTRPPTLSRTRSPARTCAARSPCGRMKGGEDEA